MKLNKLIDVFVIISLCLSYYIYSNVININYYFAIVIGSVLTLLWLLIKKKNKETLSNNKLFNKAMWTILVPELVLIIYSFCIIIFGNSTSLLFTKYLSRSLLFITVALESIAIVGIYKTKSVDLIYKSAVLNYLIYIVLFIIDQGFIKIFTNTYDIIINGSTISSILEAHEVTFVFGLLLLYYLFNSYRTNKNKIFICTIFSLLGYKRIMVVGIILVIILFYILNKMKNNSVSKIILIISVAIIFISFVWLYIIDENLLYKLSEEKNINFMGRIQIYQLISEEYEISPLFIGKGLGFISYWGEINIDRTNGIALHSGILQMYIENGFIVFTIYVINKLYCIAKRSNKQNKKNSIIYFCICVYIIICWFTDNVATYFNFLIASNVITMCLLNNLNIMEEVND